MKFSEAPIRSFFKTKFDDCIKISEYKYVSSDNGNDQIFNIDADEEVELITKCENCRFFDKNIFKEEEKSIYCHKLSLDIGNGDFYRSIKADPSTFSCSLFESKPE